ncbi:MAG: tryptophan synthase subunit alpha [Gemmatimonadetes bacterium]|nr:tryptophan synthase subunit alpha [Gemmatimonadota bacterium]
MTARYAAMFERLSLRGESALIPFVTLGDPDRARSRDVLAAMVEQPIDGVELGVPFSDPVADGPVLQAAATRAVASGIRVRECLDLVHELRELAPHLPIGLLVYANTVTARGVARFYREAAAVGVDSVLVADLPLDEGGPFDVAAVAAGVSPIYVAAPNLSEARVAELARRTRGYTYVTSRPGVTGDDRHADGAALAGRIAALQRSAAPPAVVGFGISTPSDVRRACDAGARGVIVGSALVRRIHEDGTVPSSYLWELKAATAGVR